MSNNRKQLGIGAILSYVSIAVNILAGLLYTPWMVKSIGQSQYGLYTLANSIISLFLVDFGLSSATARYLSKYRAEGDEEKANNFLGVIYKLYFIIDTIIFVVLAVYFFLIDSIYVNLTAEELVQFKIVYLIAASFAVFNFPFVTFNGILTASEKFISLKLADIIYRFLIVGLTVTALLLGFGLYALVLVHAIAGLAVIVFKFIVIKKNKLSKPNFKYSDRSLYKDIFGFSIWVTVYTVAQRLIFNITPTILGVVLDTRAIAVFGIVTTIEAYVFMVTGAINGMFMPKIARIYNQDEKNEDLTKLLLKVGKFQFALNGLIVVGFAIIGKQFINLWMGAGYEEAYFGIMLVIIPGLFYNSLQIAHTAAVVQKKVHLQAGVGVVVGIINVILCFIFSSLFGVVGACLSIFVAYMVRAIAISIIYYKKMSIDIPTFVKRCYLRMTPPIILALIFGVGINILLNQNGWLFFVIKGIIVSFVYLGLVVVLALSKDEAQSVKNKIKKIMGKLSKKAKKDLNG